MIFSIPPKIKTILIKRLKSLAWRAGMIVAVMVVDFAAKSIGLFDLPSLATVSLGLVFSEVSKHLNTKVKELEPQDSEQ